MIYAVIITNSSGATRLARVYISDAKSKIQRIVSGAHAAVNDRKLDMCNFCEGCMEDVFPNSVIVYQKFATLNFIFVVDQSETLLDMIDTIQMFVAALDKLFPAVCELDLVFNPEELNAMIDALVVGGLVVPTSAEEMVRSVRGQQDEIKRESSSAIALGAKSTLAKIKGKISDIVPSSAAKHTKL